MKLKYAGVQRNSNYGDDSWLAPAAGLAITAATCTLRPGPIDHRREH